MSASQTHSKNFLFFTNVILKGIIQRVLNVSNINKDITFIKNLLLNKSLKDPHSDFKRLHYIIQNLSNFEKRVQFKQPLTKSNSILDINFNNVLFFIKKQLLTNESININDIKKIEKDLTNICIIFSLLKKSYQNNYRNMNSHGKIVSNNKKTDFIFFTLDDKQKDYLLNFWKKINVDNQNIKYDDKIYFFFLSFFVKKNIINEYLSLIKNKNLLIDYSPFINNVSNFHFQNKIYWDEQNPVCKNFKITLLENIKKINKLESLSKDEYKEQKRIIETNIFKLLQFHVNEFNKNKNNNEYGKLIMSNSSDYDNFKLDYNNWISGKRTYKLLRRNAIYFIDCIQNSKKRIKYIINPFYISIKIILKFYGCCDETKRNIFVYKDFENLISSIWNNIPKYTKYKQDSLNKKPFSYEFLKCDLCRFTKDNNIKNENKKIKNAKININLLEGNRRKINDEFIWFLKLSKFFVKNHKKNSLKQNEINNLKLELLNQQNNINTLNCIAFQKIKDKIKDEEIKNNILIKEKEINKITKPEKKQREIYKFFKSLNNLSNNVFKESKDAIIDFLLDKKEYQNLLNKSFIINSFEEKVKLFLNFISEKNRKVLIKQDIYDYLESFVSSKNIDKNLTNFFKKLYVLIWSNDKLYESSNKSLFDYSIKFNNRFKMFNKYKYDNKKPLEKYLYYDFNLIKKCKNFYNDNNTQYSSFDWVVEQFILYYNEFQSIFLDIESLCVRGNKNILKNFGKNLERFCKKENIEERVYKEINNVRKAIFHLNEETQIQGMDLILEAIKYNEKENNINMSIKKFIKYKINNEVNVKNIDNLDKLFWEK